MNRRQNCDLILYSIHLDCIQLTNIKGGCEQIVFKKIKSCLETECYFITLLLLGWLFGIVEN